MEHVHSTGSIPYTPYFSPDYNTTITEADERGIYHQLDSNAR